MEEELLRVSKKHNLNPDEAEAFQSFARDKRIGFSPEKSFELWSKKWNIKSMLSVISYCCEFLDKQHSPTELGKFRRINKLSSLEEIEMAQWFVDQLKEAKKADEI